MQPRHNGTSPLIDEDMMVSALDVKPVKENARLMQSGAFMMALDAFDRAATRDQFMVALSTAISLVDAVARHSLMTNVKEHYGATGEVNAADIELALQGSEAMVKRYTGEALKIAQLLKQCPVDEDRVH